MGTIVVPSSTASGLAVQRRGRYLTLATQSYRTYQRIFSCFSNFMVSGLERFVCCSRHGKTTDPEASPQRDLLAAR
jgi:hypothetical protein